MKILPFFGIILAPVPTKAWAGDSPSLRKGAGSESVGSVREWLDLGRGEANQERMGRNGQEREKQSSSREHRSKLLFGNKVSGPEVCC